MKQRSRIVRMSAAVAAVVSVMSTAHARNLTFDSNGVTAPLGNDGSGNWDLTSSNWVDGDLITGTNTTWLNSPADSAIFGNATSAYVPLSTANDVDLADNITVQDVTLGVGTNGSVYNISDFNGGSLTVQGNITKNSGTGFNQFLLVSGPLMLTSGTHTFAINDSPGDSQPELSMNGAIAGAGDITVDNGAYPVYGTLAFNVDNAYTGVTNINRGRLVITTSGALGSTSGGTVIGNQGTLSIGGGGTTVVGGLNIAEPITITRNTYTGGDNAIYPYAIYSSNGTGTHTFSGPFVVDSTDARISVNSSTVIISSNITQGPDVTTGMLSFVGDYAGYVQLTGDNSALLGGINLVSAAEVQVTSQANLGGPNSPITFSGDGTLGIMNGFMTDFGTHVINTASFSGGLDIPTGQVFNMTIPLTGGNGMGKRGGGTLNLNATMNTTGSSGGVFWDAGTVNVNAAVTLGSLHLRSPIVNINSGGTLTTTLGFSSFGQDSPDSSVVNVNSGGKLIMANQDFNLSDNAGTTSVLNVNNGGIVTAAGATYLGKSANATGTLNLSGNGSFTNSGAMNVGRNVATGKGYVTITDTAILTDSGSTYVGQLLGVGSVDVSGNGTLQMVGRGTFGYTGGTATLTQEGGTILAQGGGGNSFELGDANQASPVSTGTFTKTGGITTVTGETWIGNAGTNNVTNNPGIGNGIGVMTMSSGTFTANDWVAIGRFGGQGTLSITGGTFTRQGAVNDAAYLGETSAAITSTMTVSGTGVFNEILSAAQPTSTSAQFWVGQGGGVGVLNIGTLAGQATNADAAASFTVNSWLAVGRNSGTGTLNLYGGTVTQQTANFFDIGAGGTGTVNVFGGALNAFQTYLGETGSGSATLNINAGAVSLGAAIFANAGSVTGRINLNGGTLTAAGFTAQNGGGTGTATFFFNGGILKPSADNTNFIGAKVTGTVSTGGTLINSNNHAITVNSPLKHDTALSGLDGGVIKSGAGTLTLGSTGNTYTGDTNINAGTLSISANSNLGSTTNGIGFGGGTLSTSAAIASGTRNITVNAGGGTIDSGTFSSTFGNVNGTGTLTKLSGGTVNANYLRTTGVTVSGGTVKVAASTAGGGTSVVTNLNVASGKLDVNDNKLVVTSGTLGAWNSVSHTYSGVTGQVASGYANAAWTGNGIITSQTAANSSHLLTTLAVDSAADAKGLTAGQTALFGGQTVGSADVLVMYTYAGDANLSGSINGDDYFKIDSGFQTNATGYANGDFNYDGRIDADDYFLIDRNYSAQGTAFPAAPVVDGASAVVDGVSAVPEPVSIGMLGLACTGLMRRRRR